MRKGRGIRDALASYAIRATERNEAVAMGHALNADSRLRFEATVYKDTAVRLRALFEPVEPDASVWDNIEATISGERSPEDPRPRRRVELLLVAVAAAAAFLVGVSAATVLDGSSPAGIEAVAASLAADPSSARVSLVNPASGEGVATLVVGADGSAIFAADDLPVLDADRTYQLWAVVDGAVVSAGLLGSGPTVVALRLEAEPTVLAVTVEQAGGVVVSEQEPIAVWAAEA